MTNTVVHSVQTGSECFPIDSFLLQFSSDKILEAQLFHRLAKSKQMIFMLIYGNALLQTIRYHLTITKYFTTTCTIQA